MLQLVPMSLSYNGNSEMDFSQCTFLVTDYFENMQAENMLVLVIIIFRMYLRLGSEKSPLQFA